MKGYRFASILPILIVVVGIVHVVLPLFGKEYIPTHDGEYHIIRIVEFSRMLSAGHMVPRWAPTLNSGYGIPVFIFNYPLPNYIASFIRVFTGDAVYAFQFSMAAAYLFLTAMMYYWLSSMYRRRDALVGAAVGAMTPYLMVDMFIRGSIGEVWAMGFVFTCMAAIERKNPLLLGAGIALLILSHNILAFVFVPIITVYALLASRKNGAAIAAGIGSAAFFWIPALSERNVVVGLNTVDYRTHFVQAYELLIPSWGSQFSGAGGVGGKLSFQIGIVSIAVIVLSGVYRLKHSGDRESRRLAGVLAVFAASIFLMTGGSGIVWEHIPLMKNIQYPWRLLSVVVGVSAYCASYVSSRMKRWWQPVVIVFAAVMLSWAYATPVRYQPRNERYYLARSNFTDGTSSMGNSFSTIWTGWKQSRPVKDAEIDKGQILSMHVSGYLKKTFKIRAETDTMLRINTLYYPGWVALVDGKHSEISFKADGIISVPVTSRDHDVTILFTQTPVRSIADWLSIFSFAGLVTWGILQLYARRN